ncbi:hypothetical protein Q5H80_03035 [Vibrio sp. SNU_ST1]|uniref:hypothetical protein n=1 Tax=Vibrio sp. SNU_ST1 TaxID=3064001 RepID=UPI00272CB19D|nr:hypothetical protein [Vibrio sp. SNU_ST1]WKY58640.1 hypothetical protein Q5H80_03035 [Vibrio sp. SNU_ST1]
MKSWKDLINEHVVQKQVQEVGKSWDEYDQKASEIVNKLHCNHAVLYVANAGDGKSRVAGAIASYLQNEFPTSALSTPVVFCTNTRYNRDEFAKNNPEFVVIKGTGEIVEEVAGKGASMALNELYKDLEPDQYGTALTTMFNQGYITASELYDIKAECRDNYDRMRNSTFISMTIAKVQVGKLVRMFKGRYILMDEMRLDRILSVEGKAKAYGVDVQVSADERIQQFASNMKHLSESFDNWDSNTKFVLFSAEKSLLRAFESQHMPVVKSDNVGEGIVIIDDSLQVLVTRSTRNTFGETIAEYATKHGYMVIADGNDKATMSFEAAKGSNDLMDKDILTIVTHPHPYKIAPVMTATNCTEFEAMKTVISDEVNQAIGRNTGYRSKGAKHVLVVNKDIYDKGLLELDTVGELHLCNGKDYIKDLPDGFIKDLCGELYKGSANIVSKCAMSVVGDWIGLVGWDVERKGKDTRDLIKAHLKELGVSDKQIKDDSLVSQVIAKIDTFGIKEVINRKVKYYVMPSK